MTLPQLASKAVISYPDLSLASLRSVAMLKFQENAELKTYSIMPTQEGNLVEDSKTDDYVRLSNVTNEAGESWTHVEFHGGVDKVGAAAINVVVHKVVELLANAGVKEVVVPSAQPYKTKGKLHAFKMNWDKDVSLATEAFPGTAPINDLYLCTLIQALRVSGIPSLFLITEGRKVSLHADYNGEEAVKSLAAAMSSVLSTTCSSDDTVVHKSTLSSLLTTTSSVNDTEGLYA
eukprot:GFYU01004628.1.p1 GENE.GFYU01004628.1~~GFYU01004628.1.p1  ORF type:complete len:233 (-),score=46.48 GFYU01004628.1:52-750(-)